jgi:DNA-binding NarL/FixJ family response regulator
LRQRQIVTLPRSRSSNKEIARGLGLAEGTVKVHLHSIYERIGVSSRRQLISKLPDE